MRYCQPDGLCNSNAAPQCPKTELNEGQRCRMNVTGAFLGQCKQGLVCKFEMGVTVGPGICTKDSEQQIPQRYGANPANFLNNAAKFAQEVRKMNDPKRATLEDVNRAINVAKNARNFIRTTFQSMVTRHSIVINLSRKQGTWYTYNDVAPIKWITQFQSYMGAYTTISVHTLGFGAMHTFLDNRRPPYTVQRDCVYTYDGRNLSFWFCKKAAASMSSSGSSTPGIGENYGSGLGHVGYMSGSGNNPNGGFVSSVSRQSDPTKTASFFGCKGQKIALQVPSARHDTKFIMALPDRWRVNANGQSPSQQDTHFVVHDLGQSPKHRDARMIALESIYGKYVTAVRPSNDT